MENAGTVRIVRFDVLRPCQFNNDRALPEAKRLHEFAQNWNIERQQSDSCRRCKMRNLKLVGSATARPALNRRQARNAKDGGELRQLVASSVSLGRVRHEVRRMWQIVTITHR
jgi:hypothetical protein